MRIAVEIVLNTARFSATGTFMPPRSAPPTPGVSATRAFRPDQPAPQPHRAPPPSTACLGPDGRAVHSAAAAPPPGDETCRDRQERGAGVGWCVPCREHSRAIRADKNGLGLHRWQRALKRFDKRPRNGAPSRVLSPAVRLLSAQCLHHSRRVDNGDRRQRQDACGSQEIRG